jgi:colanic acid/amylovoran biosynthesis glycosyltransferase
VRGIVKKMRLAYLLSQYPTVTHTSMLREIRALRDSGLDIQVISIRGCDRPADKLSAQEREERDRTFVVLDAGIFTIGRDHLATLLRRPLPYLAGAVYALRLAGLDLRKIFWNLMYFGEAVVAGAQARRLGVTHLHSHFSSTIALLAARVFPLTFSATIHGPDEFSDTKGFYMPQKVAKALFLCAISNYSRSQLMRVSEPQYWDKLEVVPVGINPEMFRPRLRGDREDSFEILYVARLAPVKGHPILVNAIGQLVREGRRSIRLRMVGYGPIRRSLEEEISRQELDEFIRLEGACSEDRLLALYQQCDVFVLSSFAEGVPMVLMEAMSMEIPCIATWVNGVPELIRHGVDGWLIPPSDAGELADAIRKLMDDPDARRRLGKSGRERVVERYNLGRNVARLAEVFRRRLGAAAHSECVVRLKQ